MKKNCTFLYSRRKGEWRPLKGSQLQFLKVVEHKTKWWLTCWWFTSQCSYDYPRRRMEGLYIVFPTLWYSNVRRNSKTLRPRLNVSHKDDACEQCLPAQPCCRPRPRIEPATLSSGCSYGTNWTTQAAMRSAPLNVGWINPIGSPRNMFRKCCGLKNAYSTWFFIERIRPCHIMP